MIELTQDQVRAVASVLGAMPDQVWAALQKHSGFRERMHCDECQDHDRVTGLLEMVRARGLGVDISMYPNAMVSGQGRTRYGVQLTDRDGADVGNLCMGADIASTLVEAIISARG